MEAISPSGVANGVVLDRDGPASDGSACPSSRHNGIGDGLEGKVQLRYIVMVVRAGLGKG